MSEEKPVYDIDAARAAIEAAELEGNRKCAEEIAAVLKKWGREIYAEPFIAPDGRIAARNRIIVAQE